MLIKYYHIKLQLFNMIIDLAMFPEVIEGQIYAF